MTCKHIPCLTNLSIWFGPINLCLALLKVCMRFVQLLCLMDFFFLQVCKHSLMPFTLEEYSLRAVKLECPIGKVLAGHNADFTCPDLNPCRALHMKQSKVLQPGRPHCVMFEYVAYYQFITQHSRWFRTQRNFEV